MRGHDQSATPPARPGQPARPDRPGGSTAAGGVPPQRAGAPSAVESVSPLHADDPRQVGPFLLRGRLGAGGMGTVYLGRAPGQQPVAVKVIRADMAADPDFRRRFEREVASMRQVESRFTAPLIAADVGAARPWLATAYVHGPTLRDSVTRNGPLPADSVRTLAAGVAEALLAIHGVGVIHRDLKPANVLLTVAGPQVIDFGIARAVDNSGGTTTGRIIGSPAYMSPEQARGERVGAPSDVFALGSVLVFAATGRNAFGGGNTADVVYRVVREEPDLTGLGGDLRALIEACLAKTPQQRPRPAEILARCQAELAAAAATTTWLPVPVLAEIDQLHRRREATPTPPAPAPFTAPQAPPVPSVSSGGTMSPVSAAPTAPAEPAAPGRPPVAPAPPSVPGGSVRRPPWPAVAAVGLVVVAVVVVIAVAVSSARSLFRPWEMLPGRGDGSEAPPVPPGTRTRPFPAGAEDPADREGAAEPGHGDTPVTGAPATRPAPDADGPAADRSAPDAGTDGGRDDRGDGVPGETPTGIPGGHQQPTPPGNPSQPWPVPLPPPPGSDHGSDHDSDSGTEPDRPVGAPQPTEPVPGDSHTPPVPENSPRTDSPQPGPPERTTPPPQTPGPAPRSVPGSVPDGGIEHPPPADVLAGPSAPPGPGR